MYRSSRLVAFALLLLVCALLAGCGSSASDDETDAAPTSTATGGADDQGTFPAKATHRFGTTTVPRRPERVVVVGLTEQDAVLALGYKPVATTEWYGERPGAIWPWAREAMGSTNPTVLEATDGIPIEKVAALRPDLIIGTNSGMTRADFEKLSRFAPTIPGVKGGTDYFSPWWLSRKGRCGRAPRLAG